MVKQKYTTSDNFERFKEEITSMRVDEAKNKIVSSETSANKFKILTIQLIDEVDKMNSSIQKNKMIDVIEAWSISLSDNTWRDELISFCKKRSNIVSAFVVSNNGKDEFVIFMDDVTDESVLEYNEFGFELRAKYDDIHDFMILDVDMKESIKNMFANKEKVYERG